MIYLNQSSYTVEQAVKNGMEVLDKLNPNWYERIDLEKLDMISAFRCVLGQCYHTAQDASGGYWAGITEIAKLPLVSGYATSESDLSLPIVLGFMIREDQLATHTLVTLQEPLCCEWKRQIQAKLAKKEAIASAM